MNNVRVVSDGTVFGTHIYNVNGVDILKDLMVESVVWRHRSGERPVLELSIMTPEISATTEWPNG